MPYAIPSFEAIRLDYLRDVKNVDSQAHTEADSDNFIRASAIASAAHGLYHHQNWIMRQVLPGTADPENLEQHAANRGLFLKAATKGDGTVTLSPTAGIVPPFGPGLVCVSIYNDAESGNESALSIVTTEGWQGGEPPAGGIVLAAEAVEAGFSPALEGAAVTVQTAPEGISTEAAATIHGGSNPEAHEELLARLLFRMRNPPSGGIPSDYVLWAMEVPGVSWAKCYPARRGIGTVDLVFISPGGVPGPGLVANVQAHVDAKRPVTCPDFLVFPAEERRVDIAARARLLAGAGVTLPQLANAAKSELEVRYFAGVYPGDPLLINRALAVLIGVAGVEDAVITAPAANIAGSPLVWNRLGNLALEGM